MKSIKTFSIALCAAATMLTFTQCNNAPQQAPVVTQVVCDSTPQLKIAT